MIRKSGRLDQLRRAAVEKDAALAAAFGTPNEHFFERLLDEVLADDPEAAAGLAAAPAVAEGEDAARRRKATGKLIGWLRRRMPPRHEDELVTLGRPAPVRAKNPGRRRAVKADGGLDPPAPPKNECRLASRPAALDALTNPTTLNAVLIADVADDHKRASTPRGAVDLAALPPLILLTREDRNAAWRMVELSLADALGMVAERCA
jgi:hypothetical protein